MTHDETTTKLELPKRRKTDNIVHVDFAAAPQKPTTSTNLPPIIQRSSLFPRLKEIDLSAPWVLRLLGVLVILALSMLVL